MVDIADLLHKPPDPERVVWELLHRVDDPEIGVNIVDLGLVREVEVGPDGDVHIGMTLTTPTCPLGPYIRQEIENCLGETSWVGYVEVKIVWTPAWNPQTDMTDRAKRELGWIR